MDEKNSVKSVEKCMNILDLFLELESDLSIQQFYSYLNLPKPTIHRILGAMEKCGYIVQDPESKKYFLGTKFFYLGSLVSKKFQVEGNSHHVMQQIRDASGETVHLNIISEDQRVCIKIIESVHPLQTISYVGQRSPLYAGSSAKVLLAFQGNKFIEGYLNRIPFAPITTQTNTDKETLLAQLQKIREQGYVITKGERIEGVTGIAAPIREQEGKVVAALCLVVPDVRINEEKLLKYTEMVLEGTREISYNMGYSGKHKNKQQNDI